MKTWFSTLGLLLALFIFSACSVVTEKIVEVAGNDLKRTSELAAKYNKPEVKVCADFLIASLGVEDAVQAKIQELLKEDTSGLASAGLKAALIAEYVRSFNDPAQRSKFEKDFQSNCQAVAGSIMMNIFRDARSIGSRGN